MAKRTVCVCDGKMIGIETIYTVIGGKQINIPERLKELRTKSQCNQLFCPCGCGANLILVAGDKSLRAQHFRVKDGSYSNLCLSEGKTSIDSRIVLKCWLESSCNANDIETKIPINRATESSRKFEFSLLSTSKKIAINYCRFRVNLSDIKLTTLSKNADINVIHIVDQANYGCNGQYPEALMKIQAIQGFCLFLAADGKDFQEARLRAAIFSENIHGLWQVNTFAEAPLSDFSIEGDGQIKHNNKLLSELASAFIASKKAQSNATKPLSQKALSPSIHKPILSAKERLAKLMDSEEYKRKLQEHNKRQEEILQKKMELALSQHETIVRDEDGNRWVKCEICGFVGEVTKFWTYGGNSPILGKCYKCLPT